VSGSREARLARVRCVVAAGRRVADPADPVGREARAALAGSSGLSPEGVELALTLHLETHPAPEHLDALLAAAGLAPRCHVVLAANVCTAALRALAVAAAVAPAIAVRPSRRDPGLAVILARTLSGDPAFVAAGGAVTCVDALAPTPGDEVHAYGSDATIREISASAAPGVVVRSHGTGLGVAVVGAGDPIEAAALAVARDVVPFDQRGCLSPRAVLVEGDAARAGRFAHALHEALSALSARVPRGPLDAEARAEIALYRASMQAAGDLWEGRDHAVGLDPLPRALLLPPPARVVHVVPAVAAAARALLVPWADHLTSIGNDDDGAVAAAARSLAPRARRARLGEMQHPPLDGPVDLRRR
jgi:Acyl-CoA reductase (LuxC)